MREADYDRLAMHRRVDTDSIQVKILHRLASSGRMFSTPEVPKSIGARPSASA